MFESNPRRSLIKDLSKDITRLSTASRELIREKELLNIKLKSMNESLKEINDEIERKKEYLNQIDDERSYSTKQIDLVTIMNNQNQNDILKLISQNLPDDSNFNVTVSQDASINDFDLSKLESTNNVLINHSEEMTFLIISIGNKSKKV